MTLLRGSLVFFVIMVLFAIPLVTCKRVIVEFNTRVWLLGFLFNTRPKVLVLSLLWLAIRFEF